MNQVSLYQAQAACQSGVSLDSRQSALLSTILACLEARQSPSVVELSFGNGALSLALLKVRSDLTLTAVDIAPTLIQHLSAEASRLGPEYSNRLRLVEANLDLDFPLIPSSSADLLVAIDIMEHIFDVFAFVQHCRRVLKPSGVLLLRVPNIAYLTHRLRLLFGALPVTSSWYGPRNDFSSWKDRYAWDGGHLHYFNLWSLRQLLSLYGLSVIRASDAGARGEAFRNLWPDLLAGNLTLTCVVRE